ncbi:hypothetical protein H0H92_015409 [Tricholoma furcatifolium]|nr:hypothetical protein H0H92_015409 [Tricholoma furcatifolium]
MSANANSTPKVQYRRLGKSGLRVSVPIKWMIPEESVIKLLQAAYDMGLNTLDTANAYSNGGSEVIVGKWIKQNNIPREHVIIATKCFGIVGKTPDLQTVVMPHLKDDRDYVNNHGLSRGAIFNQVDASLARLQTPYIDLLQIHRFDPNVPAEEIMKALHDLVACGKVRYIGASSMRTWQFALLNEVAERHNWTKFVSMQSEYSLLYRTHTSFICSSSLFKVADLEREMNAYCNYHGIGLIPWAPVSGGTLSRPLTESSLRKDLQKGSAFEKPVTSADVEIIQRVEELANKKGIAMTQVALTWVASKVSSPIVGISSNRELALQRMRESITTDFTLTQEVLGGAIPTQTRPVACLILEFAAYILSGVKR